MHASAADHSSGPGAMRSRTIQPIQLRAADPGGTVLITDEHALVQRGEAHGLMRGLCLAALGLAVPGCAFGLLDRPCTPPRGCPRGELFGGLPLRGRTSRDEYVWQFLGAALAYRLIERRVRVHERIVEELRDPRCDTIIPLAGAPNAKPMY